jgi:hypothetical protein
MGYLGSANGMPGMGPGGVNPLQANAALKAVAKDGFFPLRVVVHDKNGETITMEAQKVDRKQPPASLFVPPPDFKKMDMGSTMGPRPGMPPPGGSAPPQPMPPPK